MSAQRRYRDAGTAGSLPEADVTPQVTATQTVNVYNCSRLGRSANPPAFRLSFGDWFRRR